MRGGAGRKLIRTRSRLAGMDFGSIGLFANEATANSTNRFDEQSPVSPRAVWAQFRLPCYLRPLPLILSFSPCSTVMHSAIYVRIYALISPGWPVVQPQLRRCTHRQVNASRRVVMASLIFDYETTCRWIRFNHSSKPGRELELINWNVDARFEEQRLFYGRDLRNCHTTLIITFVILLFIFRQCLVL